MNAKDIGRRLAQFRCAVNLSGAEAAALAGWTTAKSCWSDCERGLRVPEVTYIGNLCTHYGLSLDWFYYGKLDGLSVECRHKLTLAEWELKEGNGFRKKATGRPRRDTAPSREGAAEMPRRIRAR